MKQVFVGVLLVVALSSCASYTHSRRAKEAARVENWDAAVYFYLEALSRDPGNIHLKMALQRARSKAAEIHFRTAMRFVEVGELQRARSELELAVQLDPTHQYAEVELVKVRRDLAILAQEGGESRLEAMKRAAADMKVTPPILSPSSGEPISLSFKEPRNIKDIYKAIGDAFGFNVLFDPKLRDARVSIELTQVTAMKALEGVVQAGGHFYKVLDEKTIIVVDDTPQNRRDYEDLVVKTFFLSNAEVKDINNMLRALIDARRVAVNEQLNSIVIRDTADKVAIAERLINANDKSRAEVVVDVELIQVDSQRFRELGTALSSSTYGFSLDSSGIPGASDGRIPLPRVGDISRSMWGVVVPNVTLSLVKSAGETEILAQPSLRITEGEKGNLVIGDRVPIPTTTFNTSQTIGGNIVPITAFQYQDVGIKIDVEPRVHHNNEVSLKIDVEVSEIGPSVEVSAGQSQPTIGTRTIKSVIRLKDGETSVLAGLFRSSRKEDRSGIPWLSDLPIIGGLFRKTTADYKKTDLILTLTPRIIRNPDITEEDLAPIWVGTESRITVFGNSPRVRSPAGGSPFEPPLQEVPVGQDPEAQQGDGLSGEASAPTRPPRLRFGTPVQQQQPVGSDATKPPPPPDGETASGLGDGEQDFGLARVSFYPGRLPVPLGREGTLSVVLDPGVAGIAGPLHFAYDPVRLEVVSVTGGDVPSADRNARIQVSHTPALGWITASWTGAAVGSGTLVQLLVRPREAGEIPLIFAGPAAGIVSRPAVVLGLPQGVTLAEEGVR